MPKLLTVAGRGMSGLLSAAHFTRWTDYEIEIIGDPDIPPVKVGEGSVLPLPMCLAECLDFEYLDFKTIRATQKLGIEYKGWGQLGDFFHGFRVGNFALHFDSSDMKKWIEDKLSTFDNVTFKDEHIDDIEQVNGDYVMDCRGWAYQEDRIPLEAPINSAVVVNTEAEDEQRTLAQAMKHGWMFSIPLAHRTSYGYMYNDKFVSEEQAVAEMSEVIGDIDEYQSMSIPSYITGKQMGGRIIRNGNASHFFEPLEATSLGVVDHIFRLAYDHWWRHIDNQENHMEPILFMHYYNDLLVETEALINLHYLKGSVHETEFWEYAKDLAEKTMSVLPLRLLQILRAIVTGDNWQESHQDVLSLWPTFSILQNFKGLGITVNDVDRWIEKTPNK